MLRATPGARFDVVGRARGGPQSEAEHQFLLDRPPKQRGDGFELAVLVL